MMEMTRVVRAIRWVMCIAYAGFLYAAFFHDMNGDLPGFSPVVSTIFTWVVILVGVPTSIWVAFWNKGRWQAVGIGFLIVYFILLLPLVF